MLARLLIGLAACAVFGCAWADVVRVTFNTDKPPFAFRDDKGQAAGIEVDVLRTALARMGHTMRASTVSKSRLLMTVGTEADIAASVQGKDSSNVFFSDNFVEYSNVAISRKASHVRIDSLADLDGQRFVIWQRGWADLGPAFQAKYQPDAQGRLRDNYFQSSTQDVQARVFWAGRVEVIVIDRTIFEWYRRELGKAGVKVDDALVYHDIFKSTTGFAAAFANARLRDQFNATLKTMRADGSYQEILNRYK